VSLESLTEVG